MSRQRKTEVESCGNADNHRPHKWRKPIGKKGWHLQQCPGVYILEGEIVEHVPEIRKGVDDHLRQLNELDKTVIRSMEQFALRTKSYGLW